MNYPKLLIVGTEDVFLCNTSQSLTVRSFIEGWPGDRIVQVVCGQGDISTSKYILSDKDRRLSWLFFRKKVRPVSIKRNESHFYHNKNSLKQMLRQIAVDFYMLLPYRYKCGLHSFIKHYSPEIVYCCSSSLPVNHLAYKIAKKQRIPFVPHFFDDWPSNISGKSFFIQWYTPRFVYGIIHRAPNVLCICDLMCSEFEKRYSYHHFHSLMHSVQPLNNRDNRLSQKKTLLYAGSIYLSRYKTLVELSKIIAEYGDPNIELVIYTNQLAWEELKNCFAQYPFVRYGGFVSQDKLMMLIREAYGLVFVESFDEELLSYTRLSMSTKIPEYLSSGRPIIAMGNINQGSIEYLSKHKVAYMVTRLEDLQTVFSDFIERKAWTLVGENAKNLFYENHHKVIQKERFRKIMVQSSKKYE